jgi:hypothetical protein
MTDAMVAAIRSGGLVRAAVKANLDAARHPKCCQNYGALGNLIEQNNARPSIADVENGWTAVQQAASRRNTRIMPAVPGAGGDLGRRDRQGRAPIDVARLRGRDKLLASMPAAAL